MGIGFKPLPNDAIELFAGGRQRERGAEASFQLFTVLLHAVFAMLDGLVFQKVLFGEPVEPAIEWLRTMMRALQATNAGPATVG